MEGNYVDSKEAVKDQREQIRTGKGEETKEVRMKLPFMVGIGEGEHF